AFGAGIFFAEHQCGYPRRREGAHAETERHGGVHTPADADYGSASFQAVVNDVPQEPDEPLGFRGRIDVQDAISIHAAFRLNRPLGNAAITLTSSASES